MTRRVAHRGCTGQVFGQAFSRDRFDVVPSTSALKARAFSAPGRRHSLGDTARWFPTRPSRWPATGATGVLIRNSGSCRVTSHRSPSERPVGTPRSRSWSIGIVQTEPTKSTRGRTRNTSRHYARCCPGSMCSRRSEVNPSLSRRVAPIAPRTTRMRITHRSVVDSSSLLRSARSAASAPERVLRASRPRFRRAPSAHSRGRRAATGDRGRVVVVEKEAFDLRCPGAVFLATPRHAVACKSFPRCDSRGLGQRLIGCPSSRRARYRPAPCTGRSSRGCLRSGLACHLSASTQVSLTPPPCEEFTTSEPSLSATRVSPPGTSSIRSPTRQ